MPIIKQTRQVEVEDIIIKCDKCGVTYKSRDPLYGASPRHLKAPTGWTKCFVKIEKAYEEREEAFFFCPDHQGDLLIPA